MGSERHIVNLAQLLEVKGGKRLPAGVNLIETPNDHPYIRVRDLSGTRTLELNSQYLFVDNDTQKLIKNYTVAIGDIVVSIVGTIGLVAIVGKTLAKANLTENCVKLTNLHGVESLYLYYFLKSPLGQNEIAKGTVGAVQAKLPIKNILNIELELPPISEQRVITTTLTCLDDKIELNNRIIANLEAQAQAIFKSWFVDFEPFQDGEFEESELGLIPKGWRVGTLDELIDVRYGKDHKKLSDGNIPVYGSGGIMRFADEAIYIGESVLIPRKGTLSNVLYVTGQFWTVDTMFYTIMRKNNIAKFMYLFVLGLDLSSMNSGSAVPSMTTNILNAIQLVIPKDEDFERFETAVSPMYKAMKLLEKQNERLAQVRDTLLPKLMSGEIEVPVEG